MDDIVKQALAKWPNVPHCYGWLNLDARGNWRMRDERAQHLNLPGDKLTNAALLGFIVRNYDSDEHGCWYFQNGPQRVYVNLEATPYIARTEPAAGDPAAGDPATGGTAASEPAAGAPAVGYVLHTGAPMGPIDAAWLTETGALVLRSGAIVAQLDDRDLAQALSQFTPPGDDTLAAWLDGADVPLQLNTAQGAVPLRRLQSADMPALFHYQPMPQPQMQGGLGGTP